MSMPGTMPWFAAHEMRLAWRDVFAMLTGGKAERLRKVAVGVGIFLALMHVVAYFAVGGLANAALAHDLPTLIVVTAGVILSGSLSPICPRSSAAVRRTDACESWSASVSTGSGAVLGWDFTVARSAVARISASGSFSAAESTPAESAGDFSGVTPAVAPNALRIASRSAFVDFG